MTYKEAVAKVGFNPETEKVKSVFEGPTFFVVNIVMKNGEPLIRPATSVDKKTGKVSSFNPMHVSAEEMKNLKLVYGSVV